MRDKPVCQLLAVALCLCLAGASWSAAGAIYVDGAAEGANDGSSWANAYVFLQDALAQAGPAAKPIEIRVAQGVYTPPNRRTPFELLDGVTLKGGYTGGTGDDPNSRDVDRHTTTLTGDPSAHQIITGGDTDPTAVLDGFVISAAGRWSAVTITDGSPTFIDCRFVGGTRNDVLEVSNCDSTLIGCRFEGNAGGGISCLKGHLTLRDCTFVHNGSSAIDCYGALDLLGCSFLDNGGDVSCTGTLMARGCKFIGHRHRGYGEAVQSSGKNTFVDCTFINNRSTSGAGAVVVSGDSATMTRCLFIGNATSEFGGGAIQSFALVLKLSNCLFAGNTGGETLASSGAVFHQGFAMEMSNCTFVDNRGVPSALWLGPLSGAVGEVTQCIVRGNSEPFAPLVDFGAQLSVSHSNVQGGFVGEGNFDADPCFVSPGHWDPNGTPDDPNDDVYVTGDYHLKSQAGHWDRASESWVFDDVTSPCIDAGDPNAPLGL
ncbi:MAG: right-handed parallel beta-helix repeat-containing protein, partial [Phycisphaerales bacterium]